MGKGDSTGMFLRVRAPAFELPTGCPQCLVPFLYLRLAKIDFNPTYVYNEPDSEELPVVEYGLLAGFSNECGGVVEFLKEEKIADLDEHLSDEEQAEVLALRALVRYLDDALLSELWSKENEAVVRQIYLSNMPWLLSRPIEWQMRRKYMTGLGISASNTTDKKAQICKDAFHAYEALSLKRRASKYFVSDNPTSLDAALLAHFVFVLTVPLEGSLLKEELTTKHPNLVAYAESLKNEVLPDISSEFATVLPRPRSPKPTPPRNKENEKKRAPTAKEKLFKRRAKQFIAAQVFAILLFVLATGIQYEEDYEDESSMSD